MPSTSDLSRIALENLWYKLKHQSLASFGTAFLTCIIFLNADAGQQSNIEKAMTWGKVMRDNVQV
jgi:hypothetical protein